MNQLYLFIILLIFVLFLMYVYKKKCDEEYYIDLIHFIQQQQQYNYQSQPVNNLHPRCPGENFMPDQSNYYPVFNQMNENNDNYIYKTPKRKKSFQIYKDFSYLNNGDNMPSPSINFTNNNYIQEKTILNNINNNQNGLFYNNELRRNGKNVINKKIFKLEDFLTDTKMMDKNNSLMDN